MFLVLRLLLLCPLITDEKMLVFIIWRGQVARWRRSCQMPIATCCTGSVQQVLLSSWTLGWEGKCRFKLDYV